MNSKIIGKKVQIKDGPNCPYTGEWGTVKSFDGENYYVAMWDGKDQMVFGRNEFRVRRT